MAGIGFELVKLLKKNNYGGLLHAYGLTTLIGSGPGLLVLFSLGVICFFTLFAIPTFGTVRQFLVIIIYLFSGSMIISSFLQYTFTRFVADLEFIKKFDLITPNFFGALLLQIIASISFALPVVFYFFSDYDILLNILLVSIFIILSMIWISTVLLTGAKSYRRIIWAFILGYSTMIIMHFSFEQKQNDIIFLLFEFLLAQCILFTSLIYAIMALYPSNIIIKFDFLNKENFYYSLVFANFFYNLGFWIDKYLFWFNQNTGYNIFPPLHSSPVYDLPMFISSLTMIPGAAVFMLQLESKFSLFYPKVMDTIFKRKTLAEIDAICNKLVESGRDCIYSLIKTQVTVVIILFLSLTYLFSTFQIPSIYMNLLPILIISAGLNVILWALLCLLYYMTRYLQALYVTLVFVTTNVIFTLASLYAGPLYYGYGFGFSLLLSILIAVFFLNRDFKNIEYTTFMTVD